MRIPAIHNTINFYGIKLKKQETEKSNTILTKLQNADSDESEALKYSLLDVFDKHIQQEAGKKSGCLYYQEDVRQNYYLAFFEALNSCRDITTQKLIEILDNVKPSKDEIKEKYRRDTTSLDKNINDSKTSLAELKTEKDIPVYASTKSDKERQILLNEVTSLAENSELRSREITVLQRRAQGKTSQEIATEDMVSKDYVNRKHKTAVVKIQRHLGKLPQGYEDLAETLIQTYNIKISKEKIISKLVNDAYILSKTTEDIISTINKTAQLLKIESKIYANAALEQPSLIHYNPETILSNVNNSAKLLDIQPEQFTVAALKQPAIFLYKPETILNNVNNSAKLLDIQPKQFTVATLKQPTLFTYKPETILSNVTNTAKLLDIQPNQFTVAALKQPQLFYLKPETILNNINNSAKLLDIEPEQFTVAALKQPPLFYRKPETILNNVSNSAKLLGIESKQFTLMALKQPPLFLYKPETTLKKVKILQYYNEIQGQNNNKLVIMTNSDDFLYEKILNYLVKDADNLPKRINRTDFKDYLAKSHKNYHFTIPENELAQEFIQFANKFSQGNFDKQIFSFEISPK